ncbi:MAG: DUF1674 domain-containing protein [Steroidobacteraceae bacterium]
MAVSEGQRGGAVNPAPAKCGANSSFPRGYPPLFSGKLCPVMPQNEDSPEVPKPLPGARQTPPVPSRPPRELGGVSGPEPTRYGDWESRGRCIDF